MDRPQPTKQLPSPNVFNHPDLSDNEDGTWTLTDPLRFVLSMGRGKIEVEVPAGFVTDFASVPRLLWFIFPPFGSWSRPAVLHDFLYSVTGGCSRFLADALFREAMYQQCVPAWRRAIMYCSVRMFGRHAWRKR